MQSNNSYPFILVLLIVIIIASCEREVTVPPPDEPPPSGYVFIDTKPPGMQIFMDGKDRRRITPDSISWLESKEYKFTLKHPFFLDTVFHILANEEKKESTFVDYTKSKKMLSRLELNSYPKGASIYLNDSLISQKTPLLIEDLLPGYYKIRYSLNNHRDSEHTVLLMSNQTTTSFLPLLDITLWREYSTQNSELTTNNLTCITKDISSNIWIGSNDRGIFSYDGFQFKNYYSGNAPVLNDTINEIDFTPDRKMLIATPSMAIVVYPEAIFGKNQNKEWQFWHSGDTVNTLPDNNVTSIAVQENGKFWFGTENGLISFFFEEISYLTKVYNTSNSDIPSDHITDLSWNGENLWVGTKSSGFSIGSGFSFFNDNNFWQNYSTINSELRSNIVNSILPIGSFEAYIGVSTNSKFTPGLAHLNNGSWNTEYFEMPDNNVLSLFKDSRGRMWFGTESSITVFENWEDRIVYTYENSALPIRNISGFLEDNNGNILIASHGGGLFRYLK